MYFGGKITFVKMSNFKLQHNRGGYSLAYRMYAKLYPRYNFAFPIKCLVHRTKIP